MKRGFTIIELLVAVIVVSIVIFAAITLLTRGASNVARGSFRVTAANESAWIISMLRADIARSISFVLDLDGGEEWNGTSDFKTVIADPNNAGGTQTCSYKFEKSPRRAVFTRECNGKTRKVSSDLLKTMSVKKEENCVVINMRFEDTNKTNHIPLNWSARIYIPSANPLAMYWKPLNEQP